MHCTHLLNGGYKILNLQQAAFKCLYIAANGVRVKIVRLTTAERH